MPGDPGDGCVAPGGPPTDGRVRAGRYAARDGRSGEEGTIPNQRPTGGGLTARFRGLDGYRAFAALGVVLYHSVIASSLDAGHLPSRWTSPLGDYAVAVFFLLSGFLLYRPFAVAHRAGAPSPRWGSFWRRRAARIVPGYWLALVFLFVVFRQQHLHGPLDVVTYFGFLQTYRTGYAVNGLSVAWTLCIEASFYLALPFLAAIGGGLRPARRAARRLDRELVLLVVLYATGVTFRIVVCDVRPSWTGGWLEPHFWLPYELDLFALGMLLAVLHTWWADRLLPRPLQFLADRPTLCLGLAAGGYVTNVFLSPGRVLGQSVTTRTTMEIVAVEGLSAFLLLLPVIFDARPRAVLVRVLDHRVVRYLGLVSFGIYLWHPIWIEVVHDWHRRGWFPKSDAFSFAVNALLSVGAASLSYWLVEHPVLQRVARRSGPDARHAIPKLLATPRPEGR